MKIDIASEEGINLYGFQLERILINGIKEG